MKATLENNTVICRFYFNILTNQTKQSLPQNLSYFVIGEDQISCK